MRPQTARPSLTAQDLKEVGYQSLTDEQAKVFDQVVIHGKSAHITGGAGETSIDSLTCLAHYVT